MENKRWIALVFYSIDNFAMPSSFSTVNILDAKHITFANSKISPCKTINILPSKKSMQKLKNFHPGNKSTQKSSPQK